MTQLAEPTTLAPPPASLGRDAFLFLDFDGTLTPIVDRPDAVVVDAELAELLDRLATERAGQVAILSGRSAEQLDAMLGPVAHRLAIGASHGAEIRLPGAAEAERPSFPNDAVAAVRAFVDERSGLLTEIKTLGVAVHYRAAPEHGEAADALVDRLARDHGLVAQRGKMVAEVRVAGSKGQALEHIAGGVRPVMLGDDVTDENAFAAARRLGGAGILVGDERLTEACYRLSDVGSVRAWLRSTLA